MPHFGAIATIGTRRQSRQGDGASAGVGPAVVVASVGRGRAVVVAREQSNGVESRSVAERRKWRGV